MSTLNISNFIWGIADDVLRDVYVRGKYRDVILPMTVIRRLDAVLEPTKEDVRAMKERLDAAGVMNQDAGLCRAAGEAFYNTSPFRLRDLVHRGRQQQLKDDFQDYLEGFSPNVQEVLSKFKFYNQLSTLVEADALGFLIEKFLDPAVNLSPRPVLNADGSVRLPGLDNHAMGTIFEELIRRFNEENNEEAGEHFTPRDVVELMAHLIFLPVADKIQGTYLVYDGACGTGGMLTVAEDTLQQLSRKHDKEVSIHLYGQEINAETYAITKADLLLKGEGSEADNMKFGSTLSSDAFPGMEFDFMLSNPPYGKSWKNDLERMGGKKDMRDPRFIIERDDDPEYSLITRSSDGQMLFLANMLSKMKHESLLGSRIAEVHNGSSLFTGDAGQGESNIRRWIIENDWLEAIVALPLNMFYNTGIATYIWVLSNRKPAHRRGKVQLIDATQWQEPLRKNLGKKNCQFSSEDIARISRAFLDFEETGESKIFPNEAFGYWKVIVERPLRIAGAEAGRKYAAAEIKALKERGERSEDAPPIIRKIHPRGVEPDPLHGRFEEIVNGKPVVVEYEPDSDLRDTEQIPLLAEGGIAAFLRREVLPYAADAWYTPAKVKIGYEISFNRYFYKPQPMRTLEEIRADILALERASYGLLDDISMVREPRAAYVTKPRIYVDTSVIGGCEDDEFREESRRLFELFRRGDATLVISKVTLRELETAPSRVRDIPIQVAEARLETLAESPEAQRLADAYIASGAIGPAHYTDALHVAIASLGRVDVIASWNFRHMVSWNRIQAYNRVNRDLGYPAIDIRTPAEIDHVQGDEDKEV